MKKASETKKLAGKSTGKRACKAPKTATCDTPKAATCAAPKVARSRVTLAVRAEPGSSVFVAGDFNGWDPTAKALTDKAGTGLYKAILLLAPGTYEYKFVINGTWTVDPECKEWVKNNMGTLNSVLRVE
ncbi:MAG: glycogen-binding domain-containing protein [Kiritimatiellia bacterium]|jgi:1,4-alpha-glucan branching enzyme